MPNLGRKYTCYSCHTKFYDLGKPAPLCPKCNADQRNAEQAPVVTSHRSRRLAVVVEEPAEEPEFGAEAESDADSESEETEEVVVDAGKEEPDEEEEF